ncbi:uncharacterized protein LOC121743875 [Salvia splendens]|uniref:uncharacterized protein LOC121743875 n=1 Tax=Salvia splendens TaxID=180675 RepID=UPI001C27C185|nr:uncharacterized protein LOC121743875 [Salvia splendens]
MKMAMKIVFFLVTVAAFVSAISGRTMEAAFFRPHFRPYPGFFGGYRGGGFGSGGVGVGGRFVGSDGGGDDIGAPGDLAQGTPVKMALKYQSRLRMQWIWQKQFWRNPKAK